MGLLKIGTRDRPGPEGIAITNIISFLPLAIYKSDAMCIVIASLIDLLQSIDQLYFTLYYNFAIKI